MWSLLAEIAIADEWYRVFIVERRVGLAACVSLVYLLCECTCFMRVQLVFRDISLTISTSILLASISLVITAATMDQAAAIMLLPTLLAVCVSGWMNLVLFWNRLEASRKEATVNRFQMRRLAALRALKFE